MQEQLFSAVADQTKGSRTEEEPEINPALWRVSTRSVESTPNATENPDTNEHIQVCAEISEEVPQLMANSTTSSDPHESQDVPLTTASIPPAGQPPLFLTTDSTISAPLDNPGFVAAAFALGAAGPPTFPAAGPPLGPPPAYDEVPVTPPAYDRAVSDGTPESRYWPEFVSGNGLPSRQMDSNFVISQGDLYTSRYWPEYAPNTVQPTQSATVEEPERIRCDWRNKMSYAVCFICTSCIVLGFSPILFWIVFS